MGANSDTRRPHYLLSSGTPSPSIFNHAKWSCAPIRDADPTDYCPEGTCWELLNRSHFSTRCRSDVTDYSLESWDSPVEEKSTLPPVGISTVKGEWIQAPKVLDFDPLWPLHPGCPVSGPLLTGCHLTSSAALSSPLFGDTIPNNFWPRNVETWPNERDQPDGLLSQMDRLAMFESLPLSD